MAIKRRILVGSQGKEQDEEDQVNRSEGKMSDRDISISANWTDWFFHVYLKYLFVVGVLFLLCMVPMEALRSLQGDIGIVMAFVSVLIIVPLAIWSFFCLWGEKGRWGGNVPLNRP
jgi:hypothetical protein